MTGLPFGFTVRVPDSWYRFEVARAGELAGLVDARIEAVPALRPHRDALVRALRAVAGLAARHGALLGAAMTGRRLCVEGPVMATLMVLHTSGRLDLDGDVIEAIAATGPAGRTVRLVELPAGRAVRVSGTSDVVFAQTLIPIPGGHGVLDLVLTSPHASLAEPMLDLFDAISATLAWSEPALVPSQKSEQGK
ncbi:hypothetical protein HII36_06280 [Nonomuraea sp. NN258]|uniref:hypothetical protein n=1 Tax=Nonomuraea antri TaxID=2730852 RepID=UPI00156A1D67|nr:hypothetical protein [Nonomuraea antri]NRQ31448.1 hypothetical protein [Nonomuraea antri]